jgi:hypothetical protein
MGSSYGVTPVRRATVFFSALTVIGLLGMVYGIVRPELAVGVLAALGVPIGVRLVGRGVALEREGVTDAGPRSPSGATRRSPWWLLAAGVVALLLLNLAATADLSRAAVAGAEGAALVAALAYVLQTKRRQRT